MFHVMLVLPALLFALPVLLLGLPVALLLENFGVDFMALGVFDRPVQAIFGDIFSWEFLSKLFSWDSFWR